MAFEPDPKNKVPIIKQKNYNDYNNKAWANQDIINRFNQVCVKQSAQQSDQQSTKSVFQRNADLYPDNNPISFENELATVLQKHVNLLYPLAAITCENIPLPNEIYYLDFSNYKIGQRIVHFRQFMRRTCWAGSVLNLMFVFFNRMSNFMDNRKNNDSVYSKYKEYERHLDVNEFATNVVKNRFMNRLLYGSTIDGNQPSNAIEFLVPKLQLPGYTIKCFSQKWQDNSWQRPKIKFDEMKPGSIYCMGWSGVKNNYYAGHVYAIHFVSMEEYYIYDSNSMFTFNNIEDYKSYVSESYPTISNVTHNKIFISIEPEEIRLLTGSGMGKKVYKPDLYLCNDNRKRKVFRIKGDKTVHPNTLFTIYKGKVFKLRDVPKK
jgi:hypothetical protein